MNEMFEDWEDPNPKPIIEKIKLDIDRSIYVVRDDLLEGGSKIRFVDYIVRNIKQKELVYSSPANGYAQMSLPILAKKYNKEAIIFMAKRNPENYTHTQKRGVVLGAKYNWIKAGYLSVTNAKARDYVSNDPENRFLMPLGLYHESVVDSIVKVCKNIDVNPSEIWCIGGSGTLSRGFQKAYPDININVVQIGHKLSSEELGRAKLFVSKYKFSEETKEEERPPFPSSLTYDSKAWTFILKHAKNNSLFWNVGK